MNDRDQILARLETVSEAEFPQPWKGDTHLASWDFFAAAFAYAGGTMLARAEIAPLLSESSWLDDDAARALGVGSTAASPWDAEVGVCVADLAICETGSLLCSAREGTWRLTSLAPPVNVVLVPEHRLVGSLAEAVERMAADTSVLITGTSRTADIEGILVRGVHGPRELYAVRMGG